MATPEIPVPLFLQAVRRRPEVWTTTGQEQPATDTKRAAAAWKQICRSTWPEFDSWTVEQKRTRCLVLQKKWQTLQKDFMNGQKNKNSARKSVHHDLLTFLVADKKPSVFWSEQRSTLEDRWYERMGDPVFDSSDEFGERESKANFLRCTGDGKINMEQRFRAGNGAHDTKDWRPADGLPEAESVEEGEGSRAAKRSRTEEDEFPEEDRHFLLSLESHMRDVPRASKLALREDMLRLVRKYTDRTRPSEASTSDTHTNSQEY